MQPSQPNEELKGQTTSRALTTRLVRGILEGDFAPLQKLPTERELAERYGVSRHVVREALKRLEALRLLRIQQGSGAYVADVELTGGLELFEYILFDENGALDFGLVADFVVFWRSFVQEVVQMAARHRTPEDLIALREAIAIREVAQKDFARFLEANHTMHKLLARATHNRVYQMLFNNLGRIMVEIRAKVPLSSLAPVISQDMLTRLVDAIEQQDVEMAALLAVRQIDSVQQTMRAFVAELHQDHSSA